VPAPESALQQRLDLLVEFLERRLAHVHGEFAVGRELVEHRLIPEAGLDRLLAQESGWRR
jgi:hypothetical protein